MLSQLTRRFRNSLRTNSEQRRHAHRRRPIGTADCEQLEARRLLTVDVVLADSFEAGQWNDTWVEDSQNDWFDSSQRAVDGSYSAEIDGRATDAGLTLANPIDLSGYDSAELTFSWFIEKNWDSGEYIALDIQSGGSWQEVRTLQGNVDQENVWHQETVDLSGYLSNDFKIRFRANVSGGREDGNVDNVVIEGTTAGSAFSISDVATNEGNSGTTDFTFTVTRDGDTSGTATVDFATADGTATTADGDYVSTAGTVTFADGVTSQQIVATVNGDTILEATEGFTVELLNASSGSTITDGTGQATILNDDGTGAQPFQLSSFLPGNGGDGTAGTVISGLSAEEELGGYSRLGTVGDVNGDGLDDILFSSDPWADPGVRGTAYLVYGKQGGLGAEFDLSTVDGSNGFRIDGPLYEGLYSATNGLFGLTSADAGDVNNDGFSDIIIGAPDAPEPNNPGNDDMGMAYVILGGSSLPSSLDVESLDGSNGFAIHGIVEGSGWNTGYVAGSAGDMNGDGFGDILVNSSNNFGGSGYVIFGNSEFGTQNAAAVVSLHDVDGINGFVIDNFGSHSSGYQTTFQTPLVGDFNGDGIDDLPVLEGGSVIMGRAATAANPNPFVDGVDLLRLNGSDGFRTGVGRSIRSAGDINADGIDDIVTASLYGDGLFQAGETFVIFGQQGAFPADFDMTSLDGTNGFSIPGVNEGDRASAVSGVGDFNGDGIDDFVLVARGVDPSNGVVDAGEAYVIYGRDRSFNATIDLAGLDETEGAIFSGFREDALLSRVSGGGADINGDGLSDFILGAPRADLPGLQDAGEIYVVYGRDTGDPVDPGAVLSISNSTVTEAATGTVGMDFVVTLSDAVNQDVTVDYASTDITATAGADYVAISGTLTIPAGETSAVLTVQVNADDAYQEGEERLLLSLTNPSGAELGVGTGSGIIFDYVATTKFYVVDNAESQVYKYGEDGAYLGAAGNLQTNARGAAADATGNRIWHVHATTNYVAVDDADGFRVAQWVARGPSKVEGIATDGQHVWLVDKGTDKVFYYENAAEISTFGGIDATSSFALANGNRNPRGITTDGTHLWVVNSKSAKDEVFKYTTSGTLVGRWTIDSANVNPRGITIDPNDVNHLWIVDSTTDSVYQYSGAASRTSGSQSADSEFALAAENSNPQGIADPPPPSKSDRVAVDHLAVTRFAPTERASLEFASVDNTIGSQSMGNLFGSNEDDLRALLDSSQMQEVRSGEAELLDNALKPDWKSVFNVDAKPEFKLLDTAFAEWARGDRPDTINVLGSDLNDEDLSVQS